MLATVTRTGTVLTLFTSSAPEWGVTEAARALGMRKSNAHEMLASLASIGLLQRTVDGRYRLGWRLLTLTHRLLQGSGFEQQARITVAQIARALQVPSTVGAWDGRRVVCIASSSPPGAPVLANGARLPGHSSALGKVLMASVPVDLVSDCVRRYGLPALTTFTVREERHFLQQLKEVRQRGLGIDQEETVEGTMCIAAPVLDEEGSVVAAISVSIPSANAASRWSELVSAVRGTANRLSNCAVSQDQR